MVLSIDAEKTFNKIQHPFLIKTLQSLGIEGYHPHPQYHPQWEKADSLPFEIRNTTRMPTLTTVVLEVLATAIRQQQKINK